MLTVIGETAWSAVDPLPVVPPVEVPVGVDVVVSAAAVARSPIRAAALGVPRPVTRS